MAVHIMLQQRWEERKKDFTEEEKKNAWDETAKVVKTYSDELVNRWNTEIDTLLVYVSVGCSDVVSCLDLVGNRTGRSVLRGPYRLQRPVLHPPCT